MTDRAISGLTVSFFRREIDRQGKKENFTAIVLFAAKKFYNAKSICDPLSFGNRNLEEDLLTHFATQLYGYLPSAFYEYV